MGHYGRPSLFEKMRRGSKISKIIIIKCISVETLLKFAWLRCVDHGNTCVSAHSDNMRTFRYKDENFKTELCINLFRLFFMLRKIIIGV